MKKCIIIYNPESGYKNKIKEEECIKILNNYNYEVEFMKTKKQGDAEEFVYNIKSADLVIIAGGDGTLNEAISGNIKRNNPLLLSHLPIGTVTDVGKLYGFTKNINKDLDLLLNGDIKNIDVGIINNKPFLYVACLGNFTNIPYDTPRRLKKTFGKLGYFLYAFKSVFKSIKNYNIKYTIDNIEYNGKYSFIFITNSTRIAGLNNIYNDVYLDDFKFEIALCDVKNKRDIIKTFYLIRKKDIKNIPNIKYYKTDNIEIIFDKIPNSWCVDGEKYSHENKVFTLKLDNRSKMLLPKKNTSKLFKDYYENN